MDLQDYDYSLDMWSLGCILAGIIFKKEPMFKGKDNQDQLVAIAKILGTDELFAYTKKYGIVLSEEMMDMIGVHEKRPWKCFITPRNAHLATDDAIDLLSKLLRSAFAPSLYNVQNTDQRKARERGRKKKKGSLRLCAHPDPPLPFLLSFLPPNPPSLPSCNLIFSTQIRPSDQDIVDTSNETSIFQRLLGAKWHLT